ncbi:hypothetical protein HMPREF0972_01502 [Actinomyces sp. oral taxon 848 str. F0332]|nr:hypothetical protein HMPREF0972_01502 [Actinomyces sp. oral taxon 848 str. F0332]
MGFRPEKGIESLKGLKSHTSLDKSHIGSFSLYTAEKSVLFRACGHGHHIRVVMCSFAGQN